MQGPTAEVLWVVAGMELGYLLVALGLLFGHAGWLRWDASRHGVRMAEGRTVLTKALGAGLLSPEDVAVLKRLPLAKQVLLLNEWGTNLSGRGAAMLGTLSEQLGLVAAAESMCRSWRWPRRVRGVRVLTVLSAGSEVVQSLFRDPSPVVRSQVAYWAASHPTPQSIDALLSMLGDSDRFCRFAAMDALHRMGTVVIEPLVQYATAECGTQVDFAMAVISTMGDEHFVEVARVMVRAESAVTRAFAAKVLGAVGGVAQIGLLLERLADPDASVREAAAAAIGDVGHWPAAPQVARLLGDPEWVVRRAAGLALCGLGAPGHLFLRRALKGSDRYAVDMARHVLDLPTHKSSSKAA